MAINVGANTNQPGFRGPIYPDGSFRFVPIPETEPTREPVPTYGELDLDGVPGYEPAALDDQPVHLDPSFAEYPCCDAYTYGDPHPVKAGPIADLTPGDWLLFYATLSTATSTAGSTTQTIDDEEPEWIAPEWGAYLIGAFRAEHVLTTEPPTELSPADRQRYRTNAHLRREPFDARVLVAGDPDQSRLFDRALPLSSREAGSDPNRLVTDLSSDSGKGPWWRRPLRFDTAATARLREIIADRRLNDCFADS